MIAKSAVNMSKSVSMGCLAPPSLKIPYLNEEVSLALTSMLHGPPHQLPSLPVSPMRWLDSPPPTFLFFGVRMILFPRTSRWVKLNLDSVAANCSARKSRFAVRLGAKGPPRRAIVKWSVAGSAAVPSRKARRRHCTAHGRTSRIVITCSLAWVLERTWERPLYQSRVRSPSGMMQSTKERSEETIHHSSDIMEGRHRSGVQERY